LQTRNSPGSPSGSRHWPQRPRSTHLPCSFRASRERRLPHSLIIQVGFRRERNRWFPPVRNMVQTGRRASHRESRVSSRATHFSHTPVPEFVQSTVLLWVCQYDELGRTLPIPGAPVAWTTAVMQTTLSRCGHRPADRLTVRKLTPARAPPSDTLSLPTERRSLIV